jgi:serine/threonine protein kinase
MAPPDPRSGELALGAFFADRYQVEGILGSGAMGTVYRVRDLGLGEVVALKVLSVWPEPPPLAVLRFREEVRLARRVTHPYVARVYDIGEHDGRIFLTMEFVDGDTLRSVLRAERRLAPARAAGIARALCEGLHAAHAVGVVHRDLKPANILIDRRGRVVISDFGVARSLLDHNDLTIGAIGTPRYMAPEQASGGTVDARTDLYALGLVVVEMLTGEPPEGGLDGMSAKLALVASPSLAAVVLRCLAVVPEARPTSAQEVARLLAAVDADARAREARGLWQPSARWAASKPPRSRRGPCVPSRVPRRWPRPFRSDPTWCRRSRCCRSSISAPRATRTTSATGSPRRSSLRSRTWRGSASPRAARRSSSRLRARTRARRAPASASRRCSRGPCARRAIACG